MRIDNRNLKAFSFYTNMEIQKEIKLFRLCRMLRKKSLYILQVLLLLFISKNKLSRLHGLDRPTETFITVLSSIKCIYWKSAELLLTVTFILWDFQSMKTKVLICLRLQTVSYLQIFVVVRQCQQKWLSWLLLSPWAVRVLF